MLWTLLLCVVVVDVIVSDVHIDVNIFDLGIGIVHVVGCGH